MFARLDKVRAVAAAQTQSAINNPSNPPWTDAAGWNLPQSYLTILLADIDGDGKDELIGRSPNGIETWSINVATGQWEPLAVGACNMSDANGWAAAPYYMTIRAADVDGDGQAELVARAVNGIVVFDYNSTSGAWTEVSSGGALMTDANGWNQPQYDSTIMLADFDGDGAAELLARASDGIQIWKFDLSTSAWNLLASGACGMSDNNGWSNAAYYSTLQPAAVSGLGRPELVGRSTTGMVAFAFDASTKTWTQTRTADGLWTDTNGWSVPQCYLTIHAADINGDGIAELVGRGASGIDVLAAAASPSSGWQQLATAGCSMSDANGWNAAPYYTTLQLADYNGDGRAELAGRSVTGLQIWSFDASGATWSDISQAGAGWTDANGWTAASSYATIHSGDINRDGQAEIIGRVSDGVQTWDYDDTSDVWVPLAPRITVDARFMENYVQESPVSSQNDFCTLTNAAGQVELFTIGTDGTVYNVRPDPASDTGYSQTSLGITGNQVAAGIDDQGRRIAFVVQGTSTWYVVENPSGPSPWQPGVQLGANLGSEVTAIVRNFPTGLYVGIVAATNPASGPVTLNFYVQKWATGNTLGQPVNSGTLFGGPTYCFLWSYLNAIQDPQLFTFGASNYIGSIGVASATGAVESPFEVLNAGDAAAPSAMVPSNVFASQNFAVAVEPAGGGVPTFGVVIRSVLVQTSILMRWRYQALPNPTGATVQSIELGTAVFAIGTNNRLYVYTNQMFDDLGIAVSQIAKTSNADGYQEIFATGPGTGSLYNIWKDADTSDWHCDQVEVQSLGTVTPVTSYTTEITVLRDDAMPAAMEPVKIWTADAEMLTINGAATFVDAEHPASVTTDAAGRVTVMSVADSLSTPLLQIWTGFLPENEWLVIEPNNGVQQQLRSVTASTLQSAGLVSDPTVAAEVANVITQSMTLVAPQTGTRSASSSSVGSSSAGSSSLNASRGAIRSARQGQPFSPRIDAAAVPEQHWRVDLSQAGPKFRHLTKEDAQSSIAALQATPDAGFLGISWGDIWESVRDGVGTLQNWASVIVSATGDAISVAITVVIDGVTRVFNGVIASFEQVFDIIEGVFETIGVAFQRLFQWLGFLFDWPDILRAKNAIKFVANQQIAAMQSVLAFLKQQADTTIHGFESQLQGMFKQMAADVMGKASVLSMGGEAPPTPAGLEQSAANNVFYTSYLNNMSAIPPPTAATTTANATANTTIQQLMDVITSNVGTFETGSNFSTAMAYFQQAAQSAATNPDVALKAGLAGLLEVLAGLAQVALETVRVILGSVLDALSAIISSIGEILNGTWNIPFVSDLYTYVAKAPLSPIDLDVVDPGDSRHGLLQGRHGECALCR